MLTRKQHELLTFIHTHLEQTGYSPSFDEMKTALGLRSKSGIHRLISALEERGFLQRRHHRARALEVVKLPEVAPPRAPLTQIAPAGGFTPNIIQGDFSPRLHGSHLAPEAAAVRLPLYGRIAAGMPIEAMNDHVTMIEIPTVWLGHGEHYVLEVAGDSMTDAGIFDGDLVVIRRTEDIENGKIVVALIEESEVTLKRLRRKGASIALEPANMNYETRIYPAEKVRVQGEMVALMRKY